MDCLSFTNYDLNDRALQAPPQNQNTDKNAMHQFTRAKYRLCSYTPIRGYPKYPCLSTTAATEKWWLVVT